MARERRMRVEEAKHLELTHLLNPGVSPGGIYPPLWGVGSVRAAGQSATGNPDSDPGLRPRSAPEKSPLVHPVPVPGITPFPLGTN